ncbi:Protein GVQW1 [Plecturocebus cupreus]
MEVGGRRAEGELSFEDLSLLYELAQRGDGRGTCLPPWCHLPLLFYTTAPLQHALDKEAQAVVEMGFYHLGQSGLELLASGDLPISASQSAGMTSVSHSAWPIVTLLYTLSGTCIHILRNEESFLVCISRWSLDLSPQLECSGTMSARCNFRLLDSHTAAHIKKVAVYKPGREEPSPRAESASTLILDFPLSRTMRNK